MYDEPFAGLDPITLNVIATLIRQLNDALGTTSIVVTYDVSESLKVVDYVYVISDGVVVGEGTPQAVLASEGSLPQPVPACATRRAGALPLPGAAARRRRCELDPVSPSE